MEQNYLAGIRAELRREETRLCAALNEQQGLAKQSEVGLERVRSALAALGEKRAARGKAKKPAASKDEVTEAAATVLCEHGAMEQDELKEKTETVVTGNGKSLQGFALRFREALKDSRFVDAPGGFRLAEDVSGEGRSKTEASIQSSG
jgi:poly-gamma-glutamate capsule biosynthesis protein CapA/YwtB (metallophosphatase superfamily)